MEDWHFWVPTGISLAALTFSAASWWHNRSAYRDQRFGEIAKLRTGFLQRLTRLEERLEDLKSRLSDAQYDLRQMSDSNENAIESAEGHCKEREDCEMRAFRLRTKIEDRSDRENSSELLRLLQLSEQDLVSLEHGADRLEAIAASWIELFNQDRSNDRGRALTAALRARREANLFNPPEA
jgi:hypothetical protein